MTFDTEQMKVIHRIVRYEVKQQLKDVPTKAQFNQFATQIMRSNRALNNAVQRMVGKMDGFTQMIDARNETVSDLKRQTERNSDFYEDLSDRMGQLVDAIYGSDLTAGDSLIEIVKRNAASIEIISKWVEKETERQKTQAKWRAKMISLGFTLLQNSTLRWLIALGGGAILGLEGHQILLDMIQ